MLFCCCACYVRIAASLSLSFSLLCVGPYCNLQPFVQALSVLLWLAMNDLAESWPYSVAPSKYRRKRKNASASPDAALRPGVGYGRGAGDPSQSYHGIGTVPVPPLYEVAKLNTREILQIIQMI